MGNSASICCKQRPADFTSDHFSRTSIKPVKLSSVDGKVDSIVKECLNSPYFPSELKDKTTLKAVLSEHVSSDRLVATMSTLNSQSNLGITVSKKQFKENQSSKHLNGHGQVTFGDGKLFYGTLQNSQPKNGLFLISVECYFIGRFKDSYAQGPGKLIMSNLKYIYDGNWSRGLMHGKGLETVQNKYSYEGSFVYAEKMGHGCYISAEKGATYHGQFFNGTFCGKGKLLVKGKVIYDGQWKRGKRVNTIASKNSIRDSRSSKTSKTR